MTARHTVGSKKKLLLSILFAFIAAVIVACGQSTPAPETQVDDETPELVDDLSPLNWIGTAIGYAEDEGVPLELSSAEEGVVVVGGGEDIWGTNDEFYYIYTPLEGDGALSVRLDELSAADPWSKAGVMIRESTEPDAKNALIHISGGNGSVFQARRAQGETTVNDAFHDTDVTTGRWLRLSRAGDTLTGALSNDGEAWEDVGSYEIPMEEQVLIGMAVTAHNRAGKATARFTDLKYYRGGQGNNNPTPPAPTDPTDPTDPTEPSDPTPPTTPGSTFTPPPATLYVSPNGNDSNSGRSEDAPLRTITRAASIVGPGDVVYLREGVYPLEVKFTASGSASQPIVWTSYPGEWAVLDGSNRRKGVDMDRMWVNGASHNIFANFEVRNGPRQGIYVHSGANDNVFTGLVVHGHNGSGIQNANSSRNRYEYLTIYNNFDEVNSIGKPGEDADGIGMSSGDGNVISHVLSFGNADDGIDAWRSTNTVIEYSIAHSNGRGSYGNGNGFKAGGGIDNYTIVRNSISYNNRSTGFTNNSGRQITFVNNTAINNGGANFQGHTGVTFVNNISYGGSLGISGAREDHNNWNLGINDVRFVSTDPSHPEFLALQADSPAIEAGVDAGYDYNGSAPDLGALEHGLTVAVLVDLNRASLTAASTGNADLLALGN